MEGARLGSVCTLYVDSLLEKSWTAADLTDYKTAASSPSGVKSTDRAASDARRNDQAHLARVFTTFYLDPSWDFNDESGNAVVPEILLDGTQSGAPPLLVSTISWIPAIRFEDQLPLLEGYDYSADPSNPTAPAVVGTRYIEPMVFIENPLGPKYVKVNELASLSWGERTRPG